MIVTITVYSYDRYNCGTIIQLSINRVLTIRHESLSVTCSYYSAPRSSNATRKPENWDNEFFFYLVTYIFQPRNFWNSVCLFSLSYTCKYVIFVYIPHVISTLLAKEISTQEAQCSVSDTASVEQFYTISPCPHFLPWNPNFWYSSSLGQKKKKFKSIFQKKMKIDIFRAI